MAISALLGAAVPLGACATDGEDDDSEDVLRETEQASLLSFLLKPRAALALLLPSSSVAHASTQGFTLAKTGALDAGGESITWAIKAEPGGATQKTITVAGKVAVLNIGTTSAPIGNIVVNLEVKNATGNGWTTVSSNVATAAQGDAATTAKILDGTNPDLDEDPDDGSPWVSARTVTENAASGRLVFTQGATTPFSLAPKKSVGAFTVLDLRFTASFDNAVLNIAPGRQVRAEIVVSSGNAGTSPRTLANLDIDGNGAISSDEARVRSKGRRLGARALPVATTVPSVPPQIVDTLADITATGTVSFTSAVFTLGATVGTVRVDVAGGTDGGTITNCASLAGTAVQACSTVAVPPVDPCAVPGVAGCGWENGEVASFGHDDWGDALSTAGQLISAHFFTVYGGGNLNVGLLGAAGFSISLGDAAAALAYLPDNGVAGVLTADVTDPLFTTAGALGSNVVALKLNIDFTSAGHLGGSSGLDVGDLTLCGVGLGLDGKTVASFLGAANNLIGGGASSLSPAAAATLAIQVNTAFLDGVPSTFAQDHLVNGPCSP